MIDWPEELVADVARRRAILFLGAGISMNARTRSGRRPKSWYELLVEAAKKLEPTTRNIVSRLIKERDFLTACEIIKIELGKEDYETFLTREFLEPKFEHDKTHDDIFKLDCRIVATPNIDKIYETRANHLGKGSLKIKHYYDEDVANAIRRPNRVILKIHGTIDTPGKMIFTRREYAEARAKYAQFYAILDALVITNTFVFLGCGLNDPDIRLLLENYAFRFKDGRRHIMTVAKGSLTDKELFVLEDSMNIKVLRYAVRNGSHQELRDAISNLLVRVESKREELAKNLDW